MLTYTHKYIDVKMRNISHICPLFYILDLPDKFQFTMPQLEVIRLQILMRMSGTVLATLPDCIVPV